MRLVVLRGVIIHSIFKEFLKALIRLKWDYLTEKTDFNRKLVEFIRESTQFTEDNIREIQWFQPIENDINFH